MPRIRSVVLMNRYLPILALMATLGAGAPVAQQPGQDSPESSAARDASRGADRPLVDLPDRPQVLTDSGGQPFRLVPITGLRQPWALAFLPNGDMLVTELGGRLRFIRHGVLDPQPIAGVPEVNTRVWRAGLMDVAVHPRYAENKFIYLTYSKPVPPTPEESAAKRQSVVITLARARFDGGAALTDLKDVFVSDVRCQSACGSRIAFAKDGAIIMTIGKPSGTQPGTIPDPQNPASHAGKVLRLNDDGTVPKDNPFVGRAGYRPEIYAFGIRNAIGLFVHPQTGEIWETEHGPMGGDEINIIRPGRNYGWPVISYGSDYSGRPTGGSGPSTADRRHEGMEEPFLYWNPSPAVGGITIYTGDKFPTWKGNIFVGAMGAGSHLGARQLHRIVLNKDGLPQRGGDWTMLYELKRRIRDVKQGPDGLLYLTVDAVEGAVLRIEPVQTSN
ncbi:MAG TPA: PQQ-dependent sugar dehydrogenase [Vicinamibacterales bacterium]|jgi:glucose/arabinose dehydrogenase|nr:PQQ-dependent sugar dehydrogenase [Vicinamibacterales bacterium]